MKTQILLLIALLLCSNLLFSQRISFSTNENGNQEINQSSNFRHSDFQFTLLTPPLSTNGLDFYKTVNDVSINTFLGISAGNEELEISGFSNVNLYYTKGLQIAGFGNVTGLLGRNYQSEGLQVAGFANLVGNSYKGVQASGFDNVSKEFTGLQAAGFANVNIKTTDAFQAAGFANLSYETDSVFQAAGFANVALKGKSKSQIAGFANVANEVEGIQAAGFINIAHKVKGLQLSGFINICDSIDGVSLGFINFVKENGYRAYEFSLSEWAPFQFNFKMGTKDFYNIYSVGKVFNSWDKYSFGFGLGHIFKLSDDAELNLDVINHHIFSIAFNDRWNYNWSDNNNMLQIKPTVKRNIGNGVCLNFGPTLNYNYGFRWNNSPSTYNIQPFWKQLNSSNQKPSRLWVGFTAGISIN